MEIKKISKQIHSANSYLSVIYGYLQLLESEISKRSNSSDVKDIQWIRKSIKACLDLKKLIIEIENELKE
ncbi:MAG: hypothetical protein ABIM99_00615 [Candidatus Dojkabacteria bacterium]